MITEAQFVTAVHCIKVVSSVHYCSSGFHPESYCCQVETTTQASSLLFLLTPMVRHKHLTCMCYHYFTVHTSVI